MADLSQSAAANDAQIRRFGSNVRQIDLLAEQNLGISQTGAKLNQILSQVNGLLTRHRDELRGTFTSANTSSPPRSATTSAGSPRCSTSSC